MTNHMTTTVNTTFPHAVPNWYWSGDNTANDNILLCP